MGIGALHGGACFQSQEAALDAYYSGAAPALASGGTAYLSTFEKVSGVWKLRQYQAAGGSLSLVAESAAPSVAFAVCDPYESFKDGMTAGWGVVACMVLAWGVAVLRRGI